MSRPEGGKEHGISIRREDRHVFAFPGQTYTCLRLRGGHDWAVIDEAGMFLFLIHYRRAHGQGRYYLHGHVPYAKSLVDAVRSGLNGA